MSYFYEGDLPMDLLNWFLEAKVPLPLIVGPPTGVFLFSVVVQHGETLKHFGEQLSLFLVYLPLTAVEVTRELFFGHNHLDSPTPLWITDFIRGLRRGLGRSLGVFTDDLFGLQDRPRPRPGGQPPVAQPQFVGTEEEGNRERNAEDAALSDRTGRTPMSLFGEIESWGRFLRIGLRIVAVCSLGMLLVYFSCKFVDDDSAYGTSTFCGSPYGQGDYDYLWDNEDVTREAVIREASAIGKKPLNYRFFHDGTRMQFPDR
ncbi:hypothetical protein GGR58DRAFT_501131 [Xylaria digitata]|nr:hypothetical protein GGR58DRAFT_501131 [Xylaria digitata]